MTASALVKKADLKRMASIAKEQNVTVWIEVNGNRVGVSPDIPDNHKGGALASRPVIRL